MNRFFGATSTYASRSRLSAISWIMSALCAANTSDPTKKPANVNGHSGVKTRATTFVSPAFPAPSFETPSNERNDVTLLGSTGGSDPSKYLSLIHI